MVHIKTNFKKKINPVINHSGKEHEKECMYVCITESLCYTAEINTTLSINYTSIN